MMVIDGCWDVCSAPEKTIENGIFQIVVHCKLFALQLLINLLKNLTIDQKTSPKIIVNSLKP